MHTDFMDIYIRGTLMSYPRCYEKKVKHMNLLHASNQIEDMLRYFEEEEREKGASWAPHYKELC
jgi:hypothetical protein